MTGGRKKKKKNSNASAKYPPEDSTIPASGGTARFYNGDLISVVEQSFRWNDPAQVRKGARVQERAAVRFRTMIDRPLL